MSIRTIPMTDELHKYMLSVSLRDTPVMQALRKRTARLPMARMQISPEQGQFMALLIKMLGAKRCIEVGTFTGYSALCVAAAMPKDGRIVCCDISEEYTAIAKPFWKTARVAAKIDLRIAPATKTLDAMLKAGEAGSYDFAFIDADKEGYADYYARCLKLIRKSGVIAFDNIFMSGRVMEKKPSSEGVKAMKKFNATLAKDNRVDISLVPIGDGLTLARKR
ncbi:MAG: class I SAM-dependent methyltransferase [Proteobacteria bacterium]|nr:class I SAM-dependent methyltransferase [Pseudomonadota bacterium]